MKKVYMLDLNVLTKQDLSIEEFMSLLSLYDIDIDYEANDENLKSLQEKDFVKIILDENEEIPIIKKKGKLLLDQLQKIDLDLVDNRRQLKKLKTQIDPEIDEFVNEIRSLWKGLKPGSMGSQNACKDKLIRWMKNNPKYSKEDILKASKTYLRSVSDFRYLQNADYFIYKKDLHGESSRLSAFIDEADLPEQEWSSNLN